MTRVRLVFYLLLCLPLVMSAQQVGKYLERPLPDGWQEKDTLFQQVLPVDDQWWKVFEDATLDSLINLAMKQNPSVLMVAAANVSPGSFSTGTLSPVRAL